MAAIPVHRAFNKCLSLSPNNDNIFPCALLLILVLVHIIQEQKGQKEPDLYNGPTKKTWSAARERPTMPGPTTAKEPKSKYLTTKWPAWQPCCWLRSVSPSARIRIRQCNIQWGVRVAHSFGGNSSCQVECMTCAISRLTGLGSKLALFTNHPILISLPKDRIKHLRALLQETDSCWQESGCAIKTNEGLWAPGIHLHLGPSSDHVEEMFIWAIAHAVYSCLFTGGHKKLDSGCTTWCSDVARWRRTTKEGTLLDL